MHVWKVKVQSENDVIGRRSKYGMMVKLGKYEMLSTAKVVVCAEMEDTYLLYLMRF